MSQTIVPQENRKVSERKARWVVNIVGVLLVIISVLPGYYITCEETYKTITMIIFCILVVAILFCARLLIFRNKYKFLYFLIGWCIVGAIISIMINRLNIFCQLNIPA